MRRNAFILFTLLVFTVFIIPLNQAMADASSWSSATNTLKEVRTEGDIRLELMNGTQYQRLGSTAVNSLGNSDSENSNVLNFVDAVVPFANGEAGISFNSGFPTTRASTEAWSTQFDFYALALAGSGLYDSFYIHGTEGTITFITEFELGWDCSTTTQYDVAETEAVARLALYDGNGGLLVEDMESIELGLHMPGDIDDILAGQLLVTLDVEAGQTISFGLEAYSESGAATAPIPHSLLLLGTGLVGLAGVRKKRF